MRPFAKTLVLWVVLIFVFFGLYKFFQAADPVSGHLEWSAFQESAALGAVEHVQVRVEQGVGSGRAHFKDGRIFTVDQRPVADFAALEAEGVAVTFSTKEPASGSLAQFVTLAILLLFFLGFMRRLRRQQQGPDVLRFEPAAARVEQPVTLRGLTRERELLQATARGVASGNPAVRRVLIVGPPGTGKTSLLKAVAHDAGLPLLALPGSEFVEVFVGVGAARIRKVFEIATASQPCIVAIDDVDAFATRRAIPDTKGLVDERAATLLELANRLDGLTPLPPKVLFIATTSRPDLIDEALTRPGRFDLTITLSATSESTIDESKPVGV